MGRFGRAAAWRNILNKEPRFDWAHKALQTNQWGAIPAAAWWNPNAGVSPAEREWLEAK